MDPAYMELVAAAAQDDILLLDHVLSFLLTISCILVLVQLFQNTHGLQRMEMLSDKLIDSTVISRMKKFRAMNTFKKLAVKVVARNFSEKEIEGLKEKFPNMDKDKSGIITCAQLKEGLSHLMFSRSEPEFKKLDDVDANGTIDYIEFISTTMNRQRQERSGGYLHDPF